jgi:hypothetical protein
MTGEQVVLVLGAVAVVLFILMISFGGKKRPNGAPTTKTVTAPPQTQKRSVKLNRAERRKREHQRS